MTALLAIEENDPERVVKVAPEAVGVEGSSIYLESGDEITLGDLTAAVLLESANDAAAAVAIELSGSVEAFAERMNAKASELGLVNTHFTNPHGLDNESHYTTARELAKLAAYALGNSEFARIVSTYRDVVTVGGESRALLNHNKMLRLYDGADGVKTGYTKRSGRCLVSSAERDGLRLVAVTLDAPDDWNDHREMLDLGFESLESVELISPHESVFIQPCIGNESGELTLSNREGLKVVLPIGHSEIERRVILPRYLWAPICEGDEVGKIIFTLDGSIIGEVGIFADEAATRVKYKSGARELIDKIFD